MPERGPMYHERPARLQQTESGEVPLAANQFDGLIDGGSRERLIGMENGNAILLDKTRSAGSRARCLFGKWEVGYIRTSLTSVSIETP